MRELLFRNVVSQNKKRRELLLSEHLEKDNFIHHVEKKMVYIIKEALEFNDPLDLEKFLNQKEKQEIPAQTFIVRSRNTREKMDKFIHKITGDQYVVTKDKIFVLKVLRYVKKTVSRKKEEAVL